MQYKTAYPDESFEGTILSFAGIENIAISLHLCEVATLKGRSFGYSRPNTFGPLIPHFGYVYAAVSWLCWGGGGSVF